MSSIIQKKIQLDQDHLENIQKNQQSRIIIDLLQKVRINDKMFDDGILDKYIQESKL